MKREDTFDQLRILDIVRVIEFVVRVTILSPVRRGIEITSDSVLKRGNKERVGKRYANILNHSDSNLIGCAIVPCRVTSEYDSFLALIHLGSGRTIDLNVGVGLTNMRN